MLNGETVYYASAGNIRATLNHDFEREKQFDYQGASLPQAIEHIIAFVSDLWQIHAFGEGNTRTTAVFAIKYLRTFGFDVSNDLFAKHSWYFRNALVRANYNDFKNNIRATKEYLGRFFGNLLLGENNVLKNKELLVGVKPQGASQSAKGRGGAVSKCKNCTLAEHVILEFLKANPLATQKEMAVHIQKSERTVKTMTSSLRQRNLLERQNGRRNGVWVVRQ